MRIAVVGSIIVDLVARAARPPGRGETVTGESLSIVPGGKGANQALACARMGASASLVGSVGEDGFAELALGMLAKSGVDLAGVHRSARSKTGVAFIVIGNRSDNTILVLRGANDDMPASHLEAMAGRIAGADALLVQLEIPLPLVEAAMGIARAAGVPVLLDPAPAMEIPDRVIALADIVTPNEQETRTLTGIDPSGEAAALEAAQALHRRGARRVVVKRGAEGCVASDGRSHRVIAGLPVAAVDTVGAGDCFAGALAVRWLESGDFFEACRFANAASALKVGRHGAQAGIPSRSEVDAFLQSTGG